MSKTNIQDDSNGGADGENNILLALERQLKLYRMSVLNMAAALCSHRYTRLDTCKQLFSFGQTIDRVPEFSQKFGIKPRSCSNFRTIKKIRD